MKFDIIIEDARWHEAQLNTWTQSIVVHLTKTIPFDIQHCEAALLCCDTARMKALNAQHRGKNMSTNVLSWPAFEYPSRAAGIMPPAPLGHEIGDIALCYDKCMQEAQQRPYTFADHALHLILHGTLHLLGFEHENAKDAKLMEKIEIAVLAEIGISDPFNM